MLHRHKRLSTQPTRAEHMHRNSVHAHYPPEIARLVQLRGALVRQINRKARQAAANTAESPAP